MRERRRLICVSTIVLLVVTLLGAGCSSTLSPVSPLHDNAVFKQTEAGKSGGVTKALKTPDPEPVSSYTLRDSVERALAANPQIKATMAQLSGSEESRRAAMANFGPTVTAAYSYRDTQTNYPYSNSTGTRAVTLGGTTGSTSSGTQVTGTTSGSSGGTSTTGVQTTASSSTGYVGTNNYSFTLNAVQPIFTGFNLLSSYQKAVLTEEQNVAQLANAELIMTSQVQLAFINLLRARGNVKSNQDAVARLQSQLKVTRAYFEVGFKPKYDVLQAEADLAIAQQNLSIAETARDTQQTNLNAFLNLPVQEQINYVGELTEIPFLRKLTESLDAAYANRPDLGIAQKAVEIASKDVKIAASPLYPQVNAQANYLAQSDKPDLQFRREVSPPERWVFSLNANMTLWNNGSTVFATRAAMDNQRRLFELFRRTRLDAGTQVKTNFLRIEDASKRIRLAKAGLAAAEEGFRNAQARYEAQVATITDVLFAQQTLSAAEFALTGALADYLAALSDAYVSMGVKNPDLTAK